MLDVAKAHRLITWNVLKGPPEAVDLNVGERVNNAQSIKTGGKHISNIGRAYYSVEGVVVTRVTLLFLLT